MMTAKLLSLMTDSFRFLMLPANIPSHIRPVQIQIRWARGRVREAARGALQQQDRRTSIDSHKAAAAGSSASYVRQVYAPPHGEIYRLPLALVPYAFLEPVPLLKRLLA